MIRTCGVRRLASQGQVGSTFGLPRASRGTHRGWRQLLGVLLLAAALLLGAVTAANADPFVVFTDSNLRAAVVHQLVSQGQIPPGSNGTTITPSDIATLTALSAPGRGIVHLDGLQQAVNLTSLDLGGNRIGSIAPLSGLTILTELDVSRNDLDLAAGSPAISVIVALEGLGAHVSYKPQLACLSKPAVSSSASTYGKSVTFSARTTPRGAAASGTAKVRLYHLETKTVTTTIKGKKKKVAVNYWRLRRKLTMRGSSTGGLSATGKLPYAGNWQAQVAYASSGDYVSCESSVMAFVVQDPRIQAAIGWAMHRLGSHSWDHYCLRFVCDCYASGARASIRRYQTAKQAADALHASSHPSTNAPRGALVFYDSMHGSTDLGHVGISLGNGTIINDYGSAGVEVMGIKCALHYIGWAAPPLSPPISDWNKSPKS